jgi:cyclic-di-GMP-binding protein
MEGRPLIPAETRPGIVQKLLAMLPASHPTEAAQSVLEPLSRINRQAVSSDKRIKLLELYRPVVLNIAQELSAQYRGHALPLPESAAKTAETSRELLTELAYGYKLAILDQTNRVFSLGGGKTLATLIQRAIHALEQLLAISYFTYTTPTEGIWSEIHRLYLHAAQHGLHDLEVTDLGIKSSVNLVYKQALMLALANPQRLIAADVDSVRDYLARFGHLAQLQPLGTLENPAGIFLVRLRSDEPAIPFAKHRGETDMRTDILLITVELARQVNEHLKALQEREPPGRLGLPENAGERHYQDLLVHLLKYWALTPKRTFSRLAKNESVNLCVGLPTLHYFLIGESAYPASKDQSAESEISLNFTGTSVDTDVEHKYDTARWLVVNESAGGMALSKFPGAPSAVHVGELIGVRSDRSDQWALGVVRRASVGNSGELEIGLQLLSPSAKAVSVWADKQASFEHALLLPELLPLKQPATLVTKCGVYQPGRALELEKDPGGKRMRVLATRLLERTSSFERFQFSQL